MIWNKERQSFANTNREKRQRTRNKEEIELQNKLKD